jgi:hypothetical protein
MWNCTPGVTSLASLDDASLPFEFINMPSDLFPSSIRTIAEHDRPWHPDLLQSRGTCSFMAEIDQQHPWCVTSWSNMTIPLFRGISSPRPIPNGVSLKLRFSSIFVSFPSFNQRFLECILICKSGYASNILNLNFFINSGTSKGGHKPPNPPTPRV